MRARVPAALVPAALALAGAGLCLAACGATVSAAAATASWAKDANFAADTRALLGDARHAVTALGAPSSTANLLHTVCGVLQTDDEAAYNSLPTPDAAATALLSRAYNTLGAGASRCYDAGARAPARARALADLTRGAAELAEGAARVASASASAP